MHTAHNRIYSIRFSIFIEYFLPSEEKEERRQVTITSRLIYDHNLPLGDIDIFFVCCGESSSSVEHNNYCSYRFHVLLVLMRNSLL